MPVMCQLAKLLELQQYWVFCIAYLRDARSSMYLLTRTDKSGNTTTLIHSSDFQAICDCSQGIKTSPKQHVYKIINRDRADTDCPDGLTSAERELVKDCLGG
jgi:hypothetical protein